MSSDNKVPSPLPATAPGRSVAGGSVVAHLPFTENRFLGSPSIVRAPGGSYVASHDVFGTDSPSSETYIYRSSDTIDWLQVTVLQDLFWGGLFVHNNALYLIGCTTEYGDLVIRRSVDEGASWTTPVDSRTGILRSDGRFHTAPVPVIEHGGRLWRAYEQQNGRGSEWGHFGALTMSADLDADLLDATSWLSSAAVVVPESLRSQGIPTWLEGNVVPAPSGEIVNVLRAHCWTAGRQQAAIVEVTRGGVAVQGGNIELIAMPGGGSKFTIRLDPDGKYWTLANTALYDSSSHRGLAARNTLSLISSADLHSWSVMSVVAHHFDDRSHGYQYCDWQFDGNDIIVLCRTAHQFDGLDAHSYHDSNLITCHRVNNYQSLGQ